MFVNLRMGSDPCKIIGPSKTTLKTILTIFRHTTENAEAEVKWHRIYLTTAEATSIGNLGPTCKAAECAQTDDFDPQIDRYCERAAGAFSLLLSSPPPNGAVARCVDAAPARIASHRTSQCPPRRRAPSSARIPSCTCNAPHHIPHPCPVWLRASSTVRIPSHPMLPVPSRRLPPHVPPLLSPDTTSHLPRPTPHISLSHSSSPSLSQSYSLLI
ncbi:hypothetical protein C8R44DRAFT_888540 [Mycena epipterygia]|nr:hypothetical protein C8R44DRAFT_888540 [Mycena epipterygia]